MFAWKTWSASGQYITRILSSCSFGYCWWIWQRSLTKPTSSRFLRSRNMQTTKLLEKLTNDVLIWRQVNLSLWLHWHCHALVMIHRCCGPSHALPQTTARRTSASTTISIQTSLHACNIYTSIPAIVCATLLDLPISNSRAEVPSLEGYWSL